MGLQVDQEQPFCGSRGRSRERAEARVSPFHVDDLALRRVQSWIDVPEMGSFVAVTPASNTTRRSADRTWQTAPDRYSGRGSRPAGSAPRSRRQQHIAKHPGSRRSGLPSRMSDRCSQRVLQLRLELARKFGWRKPARGEALAVGFGGDQTRTLPDRVRWAARGHPTSPHQTSDQRLLRYSGPRTPPRGSADSASPTYRHREPTVASGFARHGQRSPDQVHAAVAVNLHVYADVSRRRFPEFPGKL